MEKQNSTGVAISETKLKVDDLGAIPNLLDKLDVEKLVVQCKTWSEVIARLHSTKLYQRISGHIIGRVMLLAHVELLAESKQQPPSPVKDLQSLRK